MNRLIVVVVVLLGSTLGLPGKTGGIGSDRSLLSMFDAFQAANGYHGEEEGHAYEAVNQFHDGPGESDHEHGNNPSVIEQLHDGPGGHHHDDDGHVHNNHEQYRVRYHDGPKRDHVHGNNPSVIEQLHDGPRGHHHDDDGHDHKKHNEDSNKPILDIKENNEDIRQFTLIISKLLFQLSQM